MKKTIDELKRNGTYGEKLEYVSDRYKEVNEEISRLSKMSYELVVLAENLPLTDEGFKTLAKMASLSEKINERVTALTEEMNSLMADLGLI